MAPNAAEASLGTLMEREAAEAGAAVSRMLAANRDAIAQVAARLRA